MAGKKGQSSPKKKKSRGNGSKTKRAEQQPQPEPEERLLFQTEQPPTTLHQFPSLPSEVKNMIYKLSTELPSIFQVSQIRSFDAYLRLRAFQGVQEMIPSQDAARGLEFHPQVYGFVNRCSVRYPGPGIMHVSHEWRSWVMTDISNKVAEAAKAQASAPKNRDRKRLVNGEKRAFEHRLTQAISFNFDKDQLFFVSLRALEDFTIGNTRGITELQQVKSIAVWGINVQNCTKLVRFIQIFGELDKVHLLHPASTGGSSDLAQVLTGLLRQHLSTVPSRRRSALFKVPLVICESDVEFLGHEFKR